MRNLLSQEKFPWLASGIALIVFVIIAVYVLGGGSQQEQELNSALQTIRSDWLDALAIAITLSGDTIVLVWIAISIVGALVYNRQHRLAATVLSASIITPLLVIALKGWVQRPRPTHDLYAGVEAFSFPSGHTTNSAVLYGILLMLAFSHIFGRKHIWLASALGALIVLIGLSRIYLAAHWPTDVIAGWCLATLVLVPVNLVIRSQPVVEERQRTVLWIAGVGAILGLAYGTLRFAEADEKYSPRTAIEVASYETPSNRLILLEKDA